MSDRQQLLQEVIEVRQTADLVFHQQEIEQAISRMAVQLHDAMHDVVPVMLCVMNGGLMVMAELLKCYPGNVQLDYIHVARYRDQTVGGSLHWHKEPELSLQGRQVVIVDDILDEGCTLQELVSYCESKGAHRVWTVILLNKQRNDRTHDLAPDICGLEVEDRYVFGYGMDYKGYLRNLPHIYALKRS